MTIPFNQIPADLLDPGAYMEFDQSLAGSLSNQQTVLLVGHQLAASNTPVGTITPIGSVGDATAAYGGGSMLESCAALALNVITGAQLFACPVASVAASGEWPATAQLNIPALITAMADDQYDYIMLPYYDAATLTEIANELQRRWNALVAKSSRVFVVVPLGYQDALAFSKTLNSSFINVLPIGASTPDAPHLWNTALTCVMANILGNDPSAPETDAVLPYITAPETQFTAPQRNTFNGNGLGTWWVSGTAVELRYLVTSYQTNPQGQRDNANRDTQTPETLKAWRRQVTYQASKLFAGYKISADASVYASGQKIIDPQEIKSWLIDFYASVGMRTNGWFQDLATYMKNIVVEIDPDNGDRVNYTDTPTLIGQFRILAGSSRYIKT